MSATLVHSGSALTSAEKIRSAIDHAAHLLPAQGPIGVFVHHNTLHHFEESKFEEAVVEAASIFGAEPYMSEAAYRREIKRGRIQPEDIDFVLEREANKTLLQAVELDRRTLRRAMLTPGIRDIQPETVEWLMHEGDLLRKFRSDISDSAAHRLSEEGAALSHGGAMAEAAALRAIFLVCESRLGGADESSSRIASRPDEGFRIECGEGLDDLVHPLLIRLTSVYLDQGQAYWPMPNREDGFLRSVRKLLAQPAALAPAGLRGSVEEFQSQQAADMSAMETIERCLFYFGVEEADLEVFFKAELLALPGWAGIVRQLEENPHLAPHEHVPCSLLDFLAVRLTLNRIAAENLIKRNGLGSAASASRRLIRLDRRDREQVRLAEAARMLDIAQLLGLTSGSLAALDDREFARLAQEVAAFNGLERRRVLHLAYELRHEKLILEPLAVHRAQWRPPSDVRPSAQIFCCIDEREESLRRHLEEIDPSVETFGAAGFYGIAVDYQGIDDAHGAPLCPVVVTPKHAVREVPEQDDGHLHGLRQARRRIWAIFARGMFASSRTLVKGWFSAAVLGIFTLFPLAFRVLSPLSFARWMKRLNELFLPVPRTELTLIANDEEAHQAIEGLRLGFTVADQAASVASVLGPAGLVKNFSRIVVVLGHGSTSLNNPHESAHDCGACGGRRGGPNGRLFAAMANRPEVRARLVEKGVVIPDDVWFVGGAHDTCSDAVNLFDLDEVPESHLEDLARVRETLDEARARDAHERARRFEAADPGSAYLEALRHVEERAEHLAEPRPEYGHCTNAICIVGRRSVTRGLFFDRRAFLTSYDAAVDPDGSKLQALLGAVVPVCAGISLEYYFSFVDNERYGCGTKLPHNVTGLVGVMNGHASDLRTGLPWQMVEVHEPVRILFVIEAPTETIFQVMSANAGVRRFIENRWVRVASMHPETGEISIYRDGVFEPFAAKLESLPETELSRDWYGGHIDHLPVAKIRRSLDSAA